MNTTRKGSSVAAWGLVALLSLAAPPSISAEQGSSRSVTLSIEAQPMTKALAALAAQTGVQMIFSSEEIGRTLQAPALKGDYTLDAALTRLLTDTGLAYQYVNERTISIRPVKSERNISGNSESGATETTPTDELDEIVVTAQKREEKLRNVPISISVLSGRTLDRSTAEGVTEALSRVPGVATSVSLQGGGTRIAMRGVTSGGSLFGGSTPVSYYLDSVPFALVKTPIGPDSSAYDLDRVEVLRGPQGTLYGASALNGVVRVLTKDANLNELQLKARTSASGTKDGGENYRGDLALNMPIVEGKLAARVVLGYQDSSGWIEQPNREDVNDSQISTLRLKVNAQPTDQLSVGLSAWLSRSDFGAPPAADDNGFNPSLADLSFSTDYDAFGLKIGYDFAPFTISSQTSYLEYSNAGDVDSTPGLPLASSVIVFTGIDASVFSQEILLNSTGEGPWQWSFGTSFRDAEDRLRQTIAPAGTRFDWTNSSQSYAAFGEISQRFFQDRLRWTAGLRYFHDDVGLDERFVPPGQVLQSSDHTFDAVTPRAVLTWFPSSDITVYGSYSEGFRSGFDQNPIVIRQVLLPVVEPDKLRNYEIGAKAETAGGLISIDGAIYYMDWDDVQQTLRVPCCGTAAGVTAAINGEGASGIGIDLGVVARPLERLELGLNFSWNDLTIESAVLGAGGVLLFDKGDRLNLSPEYTAGVSADYGFPVGANGLRGRFSASANYASLQRQRTITGGMRRMGVGDSMLLSRASVSLEGENRWGVTLFVDNISNEQGSPIRDVVNLPGNDERVRPRSVGLQLEYHY